LREFTERFEHRQLAAIELPRPDWLEQAGRASLAVRRALANAAARIRSYHQLEKPSAYQLSEAGIRLRCRVTPLERVGLYVPGGTACLASTVLMTAIPAKVAGVGSIIMTTPGPSPETLAAALEAGVDRVFLVGGAQAIAALAYGTETVPRVDKIAGPGNAYVTAAKRLVYGDVGIDMIAGPTEVVIAADASAKPSWWQRICSRRPSTTCCRFHPGGRGARGGRGRGGGSGPSVGDTPAARDREQGR